jgi:phage-related protein
VSGQDKPLVWLHGEIKTPPFSDAARRETGFLLRMLQKGEHVGMPSSKPLPEMGPGCRELRINDEGVTWRIVLRIDPDAIVILEVFTKKTEKMPGAVIDRCKNRLKRYDAI